ncbi:MAG: hypothetical protein QOF05_1696 [Sphingomonadales bacterium]|nr:hypothetical protein [Sphingomonadales bacterium]
MKMSERKTVEPAWSFPVGVADIPETGRHIDIVADDKTRAAIAEAADLAALPRLKAGFDLMRHGAAGLRVVGRVQAAVVQNCVVTLDPIESAVDEAIDLLFLPEAPTAPDVVELEAVEADDPPETLQNGMVDLGAVATEFLLLGIDPYPRKPDAVFEAPPAGDPASSPFAALAALKKSDNGKEG